MLITLIVGGVYLARTADSIFPIKFLGRFLLLCLGGALIGLTGKLAALKITQIQFTRACKRLREEISARQNGRGVPIAWEG